jgi:hypothetical protein
VWNIQLLMDLFYPTTVQNIMNIHIPRISSFDKWVWAPSPSWQFLVKNLRMRFLLLKGVVFLLSLWILGNPFGVSKSRLGLNISYGRLFGICCLHVQILVDLLSMRIWMLRFVPFVRILLKRYLTFSWNVI